MELLSSNNHRALVPSPEILELLLELFELLTEVFELLDVAMMLDGELDELEFKLERELDELELTLERKLDELDLTLECELSMLELNALDFELERGLDDIDNELAELKTAVSELDFELEKLEERDGDGAAELVSDDKNELLLRELLIATELDITVFLLELEADIVDDDIACDALLEDSPSSGKPAPPPQAVNKKNKGMQIKALIFFTLFTSICPSTSGLLFNLRGLFKDFFRKTILDLLICVPSHRVNRNR